MNKANGKVDIELEPNSPREIELARALKAAIEPLFFNDIRDAITIVKELVRIHDNAALGTSHPGMIVGTGGSHIWIHRGPARDQFTLGDPERFALITQTTPWQP